jgi:hypothetical protein
MAKAGETGGKITVGFDLSMSDNGIQLYSIQVNHIMAICKGRIEFNLHFITAGRQL